MARAMAAFAAEAPALPLAVAFSGGADSTALLLACVQRWPGQVHAWHIHHGLQAAADDFERHCVQLCQRLGVPMQVRRVDARAAPGDSPEDAARRARYKAFDALAQAHQAQNAIKTVVIAQHADDQAETVLLALSRGAGLAGLAAMPKCWQRGDVTFWRPLLEVPGPLIRDWLREQGERWAEDPTNTDERFVRNRIRVRLLPALEVAFPQFRATFARSAAHAAQAQALLHELAAQDLALAGSPPRIAALQALSSARQTNVLRYWLARQGTSASTAQMTELLSQIAACTTRGHRISLKVGAGWLERQGETLAWVGSQKHPTHQG
ncbi:MAG: tRNA lysidine(34) synthetase TilS [Pseudomonadota bacterium]|nr:tRNA lysidine(34) synthetase TilS [Pseudomonadota bacterium]